MRKVITALTISTILTLYSVTMYAGVPQTKMECKSASGKFTISGAPQGERFDLTIKSGNAVIHYMNGCDGTDCPISENYGMLTTVDALVDNVFTISFAKGDNRGVFYALPHSVQYIKYSRGYNAQYKAIYLGDDPASTAPIKEFVKNPGVELICTQESKL